MMRAYREKHAQTENELKSNIICYQGDLSKCWVMIKELQKEKDALMNKLRKV